MNRSATATPELVPVDVCPACGSEHATPIAGPREQISIVRCAECELVHADHGYAPTWLDDRYAALARLAPAATDGGPRPGTERKRAALTLYDRLSGGRLLPAPEGAVALDIGCNTGMLLDLLRESGYRTVGIERSPSASEAAGAGHEVLTVDVESGVGLAERFDVITMTHVLEHLRRPVAALEWVRAHLADDGVAVVEVPNWDDLSRPLWGLRYRPLELGDHLSFFQRDTLAAVARTAGLEVRTLWSAPQLRAVIFPSLLTAMSAGRAAVRHLRHRGEVAATRVAASEPVAAATGRSHAVVSRVLAGLDRLDPPLERVVGSDWKRGANLIAIMEVRR